MNKILHIISGLILLLLFAGSCHNGKSLKDGRVLVDVKNCDTSLIKSKSGAMVVIKNGTVIVDIAYPVNNQASVSFLPSKGTWDITDYLYLIFEIQNRSQKEQLVECYFNRDRWSASATLIPPNLTKELKVLIFRRTYPQYFDSLFRKMNGLPDGIVRHWEISKTNALNMISLSFPLAETGESFIIKKIGLTEPIMYHTIKQFSDGFFPFVDEFGQYKPKEWPGKIHSVNELIEAEEMEKKDLTQNPGSDEWNEYGGWKNGPQLKATGSFRAEKYKGKWWMVDPSGKLFWSHGIDCVRSTDETLVTGRKSYFSFLPKLNGQYSEFLIRSGRDTGSMSESINYRAMNLSRKFGANWKEIYAERAHLRLKSWGMNTIAAWSDPIVFFKSKTPYFISLSVSQGRKIADPFDKDFQSKIERQIKERYIKSVNDPFCIGYFIDNELDWNDELFHGREVLKSSPDKPAKIALQQKMQRKYGSIRKLNKAWVSSFKSWNDFLQNKADFEKSSDDIREFTHDFVVEYFTKCRKAIKSQAPDKLYMGSRLDFHFYPTLTNGQWVVEIAAKFCDIVSFNRYNYSTFAFKPLNGLDFPALIGEFHFGSLDRGLLHCGVRYVSSQEERVQMYNSYVSQAVKNEYLVGTNWFQYADQAVTGRGDGENYQIGFLSICDVPYYDIIKASREIGKNMYRIRANE